MHGTLGTERLSGRYMDIQEKESHRFLFRVLQEPDLLFDHLKVYVQRGRSYIMQSMLTIGSEAAAIILKIVYGYTVDPHEPDPLVQVVDAAMARFGQVFAVGAWLVDIIPACT